ncbi:TlpA family protein disulfide reductase [candidate division KSB1 bacterium]|nr:TlpA family protein disulfide reductase [candidate division KSB1 bacterium]
MKKVIIALSLLLLVWYSGCSKKGVDPLTHHPGNPQPGQEITITYDASETALAGADSITLLAYLYAENAPQVTEIGLTNSGSKWTGTFKTEDSTLVVVAILKSGEKKDDNAEKGYLTTLYGADGNPVKGSLSRQAIIAYTGGNYPLRLSRDPGKAKTLFEKEFELYPEQKQNTALMDPYWSAFYRTQKDSALPAIKAELDRIAQITEKTTEQLVLLVNWYDRIGEGQLSDIWRQELINKEPLGKYAEYLRQREIMREASMEKKENLVAAFAQDFPNSEALEPLHANFIRAYLGAGQGGKALDYLDKNVKKPSSVLLNYLAWNMVEKGIQLEKAAELAAKAVELSRSTFTTEEKPGSFTASEWKENLERQLGNALDTHATALLKLGKKQASLPLFEEAIDVTHQKDIDIWVRYCRTLYETGMIAKAYSETEALVKAQPTRKPVRELFREIYVEKHGSDKGLAEFFAQVDKIDHERKMERLNSEMLNLPAPAFTLTDLAGNPVSLKDFKGKTVILDFWATWCGPCVRSFPAMQQAVNKYQADNTIKFLFINTWERGEDNLKITANVKDFIQSQQYTFHVLRDEENAVVSAYNVSGIPTKFIIDADGKIRFKNVGYNGDDELLEELELMIAMLRN